jgi:hypothetical protein
MKGCLLFFGTSMRRVERLETDAPGFIRTTALPEQSDVAYGQSEWILEPEAGGTRVTHRLTIQPAFRVPPVLGPWLLRKGLRKHGAAAVDGSGPSRFLRKRAVTPVCRSVLKRSDAHRWTNRRSSGQDHSSPFASLLADGEALAGNETEIRAPPS